MNKDIPGFLVSIHCITYNHAPYIEDAMNGFCMQETTFPFVTIIVDDASTDGEPEVIKAYLHKHFDMQNARQWETDDAYFIETRHKENQNCTFAVVLLKYNFWQAKKVKEPLIKEWMDCKYIALCEGDDYWTCPTKIQEQIMYLESHPECGFVYSDVLQFIQSKGIYEKSWCEKSTFSDMLLANKVCTATTCFRTDLYQNYVEEISPQRRGWVIGDYPMWLYYFANSSPHYLEKIMGVYRVLEDSASHCKSYDKRERFICSSCDIIMLFAEKYGRSDLLPTFAKNKVQGLIRSSDLMGGNTSVFFFPIFWRYRLGWPFYIDAISTHSRMCRKVYLFVVYLIGNLINIIKKLRVCTSNEK